MLCIFDQKTAHRDENGIAAPVPNTPARAHLMHILRDVDAPPPVPPVAPTTAAPEEPQRLPRPGAPRLNRSPRPPIEDDAPPVAPTTAAPAGETSAN